MEKEEFADFLSQLKREFAEIIRLAVDQEYYPVNFKAIVDVNGRITIPIAEREVEKLEPGTIIQVKMKIVKPFTRPELQGTKIEFSNESLARVVK